MEFLKLLDDEHQLKLELLEILRYNTDYISLSTLEKRLDISNYLLKKTVQGLLVDYKKSCFRIPFSYENEDYLSNIKIHEEDPFELRAYYFSSSLKSKMFLSLVFERFNLEDFSKTYYLGKTKTYRIRKDVFDWFKQYGVLIKNNQVIGDEVEIRNIIFGVLFFFFNSISNPFDADTKKKINFICSKIEVDYAIRMTRTEKAKFELFLGVVLKRIDQRKIIDTHKYDNVIGMDYVLYNFFITEEKLTKRESELEWQNIYLYLHVFEILPYKTLDYTEKISLSLTNINEAFIHFIEKRLFTTDEQKSKYSNTLLKRIIHINEKLLLFKFSSGTFIEEAQIAYFEENYKLYHLIVLEFINEWLPKWVSTIDNEEKVSLYYSYIFELINIMPISEFEESIQITVDFSAGESYSLYIEENIKSLRNFNISINRLVHSKTQIYISDFYNSSLKCEQVIWKNPPNDVDWGKLVKKIVDLRMKK